ncbi:MAG: signal transduction histidine kinase [Planctomycetota bacterium]|jgi:signal transduction histidine kinase
MEDVLDLSQINSGVLTIRSGAVDLIDCLRDAQQASSAVQDEVSSQVEFTHEPDDPGPLIRSDGTRVSQLVRNLVENARRHADSQDVKITATMVSDPSIENALVRISVLDFGEGIPDDKFETIFEPFQQLENCDGTTGQGAGLGLSICKNLAVALGGDLNVEMNRPQVLVSPLNSC